MWVGFGDEMFDVAVLIGTEYVTYSLNYCHQPIVMILDVSRDMPAGNRGFDQGWRGAIFQRASRRDCSFMQF